MRALRIDLLAGDRAQRQERRHQQQHRDDEDRARRKQITARAHRRRGQAVADRGEARIAAEPLADRRMADQAEADRGHGRAEHATRQRMQHRTRQHHRKDRQRRIGQGADADRHDGDAGDEALRTRGIDQRAARHLADQRNEAGRGQDEPDIDLRPSLRGEINRDERAEAGLHVGDKENEPVEPAQAVPRRQQRRLRPFRLVRCRRRQTCGVLASYGSGRSRMRRNGFAGRICLQHWR